MAALTRAEPTGQERKSHEMGMHSEQLKGRTQQVFFDIDVNEPHYGFGLPDTFDVDFNKRAEIDASKLQANAVNRCILSLMGEGYGSIVIKNPGAKHSLAVGILNRLNLIVEGSLGYFGVGLLDGPNVRITGRVGWSCGDLVCKGDVGSRTGIDMKGGNIIVGGNTGAFSGFMMQRGRMVICGDAGKNLGDSMYDGVIFIAGEPQSLGVDAVWGEMTDLDKEWLTQKLTKYDVMPKGGVESFRKIVAGKQLWNYDNLEPTEKKLVL